MKTATFLKAISDEQGPLQIVAADLIERMSMKEWEELCAELKKMVEEVQYLRTLNLDRFKQPAEIRIDDMRNNSVILINGGVPKEELEEALLRILKSISGTSEKDRHPITKEVLDIE